MLKAKGIAALLFLVMTGVKCRRLDVGDDITGSGLSSVVDVLEEKLLDCPCISGNLGLIREMAARLDEKADELKAWHLQRENVNEPSGRPFGPARLVEAADQSQVSSLETNEHGFACIETFGWADAAYYFAKAEGTRNMEDWARLKGLAVEILQRDYFRAHGFPYNVAPQDLALLPKFLKSIGHCLADSACSEPVVSADIQERVIDGHVVYGQLLKKIRVEHAVNRSRRELMKLEIMVAMAVERNSFRKYHAARKRGREIVLPLRLGDYYEVRKEISEIIENFWRNSEVGFRIEWREDAEDQDIYRLEYDRLSRSHVHHDLKRVMLGSDLTEKVIAHEIGHVIGLPDRYYYVWHENQCQYSSQHDPRDVMSWHETGSVTKEAWQAIVDAYVD